MMMTRMDASSVLFGVCMGFLSVSVDRFATDISG
jgi:hypothetical protein